MKTSWRDLHERVKNFRKNQDEIKLFLERERGNRNHKGRSVDVTEEERNAVPYFD